MKKQILLVVVLAALAAMVSASFGGIATPPTAVVYRGVGAPVDGVNTVGQITFGATVTGGTCRLKAFNIATLPITWVGNDATLQSRIEAALNSIKAVGISGVTTSCRECSGDGHGSYEVIFSGAKVAKLATASVAVYSNALVGVDHSLVASTLTPGETADGRSSKAGSLFIDTATHSLYTNMTDGPNVHWCAPLVPPPDQSAYVHVIDLSSGNKQDTTVGLHLVIGMDNDAESSHFLSFVDGQNAVEVGKSSATMLLMVPGHSDGLVLGGASY